MKTRSELFDFLAQQNIATKTYDHKQIFTVEEGKDIHDEALHGAPTKNLFLKDDKKRLWLITAHAYTPIALKEVAKKLKAPKLRFAKPDLLLKHLGVTPGSVTPFALINDTENVVTVILDEKLFDHPIIGVHPLKNDATTAIAPQDLQTFIQSCGTTLMTMDFQSL